jgi:hypothetical protein
MTPTPTGSSQDEINLASDVTVQVDVPSATAAALATGASVQVSLDGSPVQVTERSPQPAAGPDPAA